MDCTRLAGVVLACVWLCCGETKEVVVGVCVCCGDGGEGDGEAFLLLELPMTPVKKESQS